MARVLSSGAQCVITGVCPQAVLFYVGWPKPGGRIRVFASEKTDVLGSAAGRRWLVGWPMSASLQAELVLDALWTALVHRRVPKQAFCTTAAAAANMRPMPSGSFWKIITSLAA